MVLSRAFSQLASLARREVRNPVDGIASFLPDINTPQQIASENAARSAILVRSPGRSRPQSTDPGATKSMHLPRPSNRAYNQLA
jgi:hypothetical protein